MATLVMCFRCEWSSSVAREGACPRCGVSLYSVAQQAAGRVTPISEPIEMYPAPPAQSRRPTLIVLTVAGLVLVAGLLAGRPQPIHRARAGMAEELRPMVASSREVDVSPGLFEAAGEAGDLITFATLQDVGLYRLWRVELDSARAIPGPVVARPAEIRLQPGAEDRRLAFRVAGGALFSLEGFHAARPQWMTGDVSSFAMADGRHPIGVSMHETIAPWGGGSEVRVSVAPVTQRLRRATPSFTYRGLDARGARAVGSRAFVWGTMEGRNVVMRFGSDGGRPRAVEVLDDPVLDVAPDGSLLVEVDDGPPLLRRPDGAKVPFGLEVDSVSAWSPDGEWAVASGAIEPTEDWLWLVSLRRTGAARPLGAAPGAAGFTRDGRFVVWTEDRALEALELDTGMRYRIDLPRGFPEVVGPIVAG